MRTMLQKQSQEEAIQNMLKRKEMVVVINVALKGRYVL